MNIQRTNEDGASYWTCPTCGVKTQMPVGFLTRPCAQPGCDKQFCPNCELGKHYGWCLKCGLDYCTEHEFVHLVCEAHDRPESRYVVGQDASEEKSKCRS